MKILIVDDDKLALELMLAEVVDIKGVEIMMLRDEPLLAIDYIKNGNRIDLAFLDINMDVIGGIELAKKLIKLQQDIKIVFITGYSYDEKTIKKEFDNNLYGYCNKPYKENDIARIIARFSNEKKSNTHDILIKTFGVFDIFVNGISINFSSSKSKELFALLVYHNGSNVSMGTVIANLWPNVVIEKSKKLYRDAVWRLRKTLFDYDIEGIVEFRRANLKINTANIQCDSWNKKLRVTYSTKDYMPNYEWSNYLERT